MPVPEFWIIAGPNGAGKTTLAQQQPIQHLLPDVIALNPDDRTLEIIRQAGFPTFADAPAEFLRQSFLSAADWYFVKRQSEFTGTKLLRSKRC